jgi:L-malate glycosyltransferase
MQSNAPTQSVNVQHRKPRVLMVLEATFPVYGGGGAESQVLTLGKCLSEQGVDVHVIVPMVANGPQIRDEDVSGLRVHRIAYPRIRGIGGAVMLTKLAWKLFSDAKNYDFIHAHIANNMAAVSALLGSILGKRVLIKLTGMKEMVGGILDPKPTFATRLKQWAMRRGATLQATSTRIARLLEESGFARENIVVLPNGVDSARFSSANDDSSAALKKQLCGDATKVGIFVGRLAPEKGHELLLSVWSEVFRGATDVRLLLVGDGPKRPHIETLAQQLGIADQVVFAGHTDDVAPYLRIATFGLLTSLAEGLSNSLLEYMASELPVVGSRVSGTEDFVQPHRTGWLFEPGERESLKHALTQVAIAPPETLTAMGENAAQHIKNAASLTAVTSALLAIYQFENTTASTVRSTSA